MRKLVIVVAVMALTAAACGGDDGAITDPSTTPSSTTTSSAIASSTSTAPPITDPTSAPATASDVGQYLGAFLLDRMKGHAAEAYLTPDAQAGYAELALYGDYLACEVTDIEQVDANSFSALLHLETPEGVQVEAVGVGPGEDLDSKLQPLVVRFAVLERYEPTAEAVTVGKIVTEVQRQLDEAFAAEVDPPEGVLGAMKVICSRTGAVTPGEVFNCVGLPRTDPPFMLDAPGIVMAVLDESGTVAWGAGTDIPDSTDRMMELYEGTPPGLRCADLRDPSVNAGMFSVVGLTVENQYFWSLLYWFLEGRPPRMDADGNGVPCETLYPASVVAEVWGGGAVH